MSKCVWIYLNVGFCSMFKRKLLVINYSDLVGFGFQSFQIRHLLWNVLSLHTEYLMDDFFNVFFRCWFVFPHRVEESVKLEMHISTRLRYFKRPILGIIGASKWIKLFPMNYCLYVMHWMGLTLPCCVHISFIFYRHSYNISSWFEDLQRSVADECRDSAAAWQH